MLAVLKLGGVKDASPHYQPFLLITHGETLNHTVTPT